MPRLRPEHRLDKIAESATEVFIKHGFTVAKVADIARAAKVGPGTIYLYCESKEALFDLAIRRALEDPTVWDFPLPHPTPSEGAVADAVWRCLQNASHFPRLWLAIDSRPPAVIGTEVRGVVAELYNWLHRYRRAIMLVDRCGQEWPDVAQVFQRRFWRGGIRRIADYLKRRTQEGVLPGGIDEVVAAHVLVEALTRMAVHRHWSAEGAGLAEERVMQTTERMLLTAITGASP